MQAVITGNIIYYILIKKKTCCYPVHATKAYTRRGAASLILTSAPQLSGHFTSRPPYLGKDSHECIGGWTGTGTGTDVLEKRETSCPRQNSNPRSYEPQSSHFSDYAIPRPLFFLLCHCDPTRIMASSFLRFLDHTRRRTTVTRTPLDE